MSESARMGSSYIGTEHLLMGILREGGNMALRILRTMGVDPNKMYSSIVKKLHDTPHAAAGGAAAANREGDKKTRRWPSSPATLPRRRAPASWTP